MAIILTHAGNDQKMEFLLYKEGASEPYRSLHLRIGVEALTEGSAQESLPSPTPSPNPR